MIKIEQPGNKICDELSVSQEDIDSSFTATDTQFIGEDGYINTQIKEEIIDPDNYTTNSIIENIDCKQFIKKEILPNHSTEASALTENGKEDSTLSLKIEENKFNISDNNIKINIKHYQSCAVRLEKFRFNRKNFVCPLCDYLCSKEKYLPEHKRTHSIPKPKSCTTKQFHSVTSVYPCNDCKFIGPTLFTLVQHRRQHTGKRPYQCDQCDYGAINKYKLEAHKLQHTGEQPYKCNICDYSSKYKHHFLKHMSVHENKLLYSCEQCDFRSNWPEVIKRHQKTHTGERTYKCDECEYIATYKHHLIKHMIVHKNKQPYACNVCGFRSNWPEVITRHQMIHTSERPFNCNECEYKSATKAKLRTHRKRMHENINCCKLCSYKTPFKSAMNNHLLLHTKKQFIKCDKCDYRAADKWCMMSHKLVHANKVNVCKFCDFKSKYKQCLMLHLRQHMRR